MGDRDSYAPGLFCWADLGATDREASKSFYGALFGWAAADTGTHTTFTLDGREVAAVHELGEAEREQIEPRWLSFVSVEDLEGTVARARELEAEVLGEPFDVLDAGRMAALRDPTGAAVNLWQPRGRNGAGRVNEPGCMVWNELATPDPERARAFYSELLGWTTELDPSGYATIKCGDAPNGGIRPAQPDEAPNWLVYFVVSSCEEAVAAVRDGGGTVVAEPMTIPVGRMAVVTDPQGAPLALYEGQTDP
jgi:predicted enzyme related to lactoylglutathione lyase